MGSGLTKLIGTSGQCDTIRDIFEDKVFLPIGAILSSLCYLYIFYLYFVKKPAALMRHPTTIAVYKCVFEFVFVQQYIWEPFIPTDIFYLSSIDDPSCESSPFAGFLAFFSQFSLLGGELVFFVITIDLYLAYTSPFSAFSHYQNIYLLIVFGISLLTAFALIYFGPGAYGVAAEGVVWIQDRKGKDNNIKIILFYDFMAVIYSYCILTSVILTIKMKQGFAKTLEVRLSIMKRSLTYIVGYSSFWILFFSLQIASFLFNRVNAENNAGFLSSAAAYCFAFRGLCSLAVILLTNRKDLRWQDLSLGCEATAAEQDSIILAVEEGISMKPHLNSALRAEILYFTTQGIIFSAQQFYKISESSRRSTNLAEENDDNDDGLEDMRESSFSFKDKLNLGTASDIIGSLSSLVSLPATRTSNGTSTVPHSVHTGSITVDRNVIGVPSTAIRDSLQRDSNRTSESLLSLNQRMETQHSIVNKSIGREIDKEIDELGILKSHSVQSYLSQQNREILLASMSSGKPSIIEPSAKRSTISDISVNSPFYAHQEMERELQQQVQAVDRPSVESGGSESSSSTIRWRDTSDLQFRMVHSPNARMDDRLDDSRWERMSNSHGKSPSSSVNPSTDTVASSSLQRLKNSILQAWQRTSGAALTAVGGKYDDFTFTDFSPRLFAIVREFCKIDPKHYVRSFIATANEKFTEGRSGAFMFSSENSEFIVKTTTRQELLKLLKIMPKYIKHLRSNPYSLIIKFLGAHCITMYSTKIYFLVMLNVFPKEKMSEKYDLKGSWVNRSGRVPGSNLTRRERMKFAKLARSAPLLMDNDLQQKITLQDDVAKAIRFQINADSNFLQSLNLMDYSLLIGVVNRNFEVVGKRDNRPPDERPSASGGGHDHTHKSTESNTLAGGDTGRQSRFSSRRNSIFLDDPFMKDDDGGMSAEVVQAPGTYYFGIIDILQEWNFSKKLERIYKCFLLLNDPEGISAINPLEYQQRFMRRVGNDIFESTEEHRRSRSRNDTNSLCMMAETPRPSGIQDDDVDIYY